MVEWLSTTWWSFDAAPYSTFSQIYRGINLVEGAIWCLLALLVAVRFALYRQSAIELLYAAAFLTFGLSDFREAHALQTWLIAAKALNLVALVWLRHIVLGRYYPSSRTF
ncbi:MAG: hypothetical protein K2Y37_16785 [Pirellulales bacterium]|nr:hypothetical protein [Pirellulales bacterium]